jgi:hypothetical protein
MNEIPRIPYLAAEGFSRPIPLERFLPNCPVGVVSQYLSASSANDGWLLDPFGSHPLLDIEAAAYGRRVLVTANNPILAFMLRMLANPRRKNEYLSALAELASEQRGSERLETQINALYRTRCATCRSEIQANGYLWQRGLNRPHARLYNCPVCGDEGERPLTEEDLKILEPIQRGEKLPYARAVARVLGGNNEDRPAVEEALKLYNPRALYVLFTLLNKMEGMDLAPEKRELLEALMLSGLEAGTSLWPWPNTGDPPRMLNVPAEYLEKNIWKEIENSIALWSQPTAEVELTVWPELPRAAGICVFRGPIRALTLPDGMNIDRILALPPRPNQALWTLSALWSAWLWGRESETSFSQVLGRRRFDWHWHTQALHHALSRAANLAADGTEAFTIIGEPSPGMVLAAVAAANCANLELQGMAYHIPDDPIECLWKVKKDKGEAAVGNAQTIARTAIQDLLSSMGEPVEYMALFAAIAASLAVNAGFPQGIEQYSQEKSSELQGIIARLFGDRDFLRRFEATSQELDSGKWSLFNPMSGQQPLADRVENAILELLRGGQELTSIQIRRVLNTRFPGFLTPSGALVEYCLRAYADWERLSDIWSLREGEEESVRAKNLEEVRELLGSLASKTGFDAKVSDPLIWTMNKKPVYRLWLSTTACLPVESRDEDEAIENVLVFPGSRAELLKYKLLRDPLLRERTAHHWHFLKFRALRSLAARTDLTPEVWQMMLDSDPISLEETTQLRMFG